MTQKSQTIGQRIREWLQICARILATHYRANKALYWIAGIFILISFVYQWLLLRQYSQYIFDLGMWNRHFWSLIHFDFGPNPLKGFNLLGDHAHFLLVPLAPLYALFQNVYFFFVVQSVAVAVSIFPIYRIARRTFNEWQSLLWIVAYLSFFGFWGAFTYSFHEVIVAVPMLAWMLKFLVEKHWKALFILSMFLLLLREDMPLYVMAFGFVVAIFNRKWWWGAAMIGIAAAYYLLVTDVIMPAIAGFTYYLNQTPLGSGPGEILRNAIQHPGLLVKTFIQPEIKLELLLGLFGTFGFLALLSLPALVILAPAIAARFMSFQAFRWDFGQHYSATQGPILIVGALLGAALLIALLAKYAPKLRAQSVKTALVIAVVACSLVAATAAQMRYETYARMTAFAFWRTNPVIDSTNKAASLIPADASVAASGSFPQLTSRKDIYLWPAETSTPKIATTIKDARPEYIIVSLQLDDAYMPETREQLEQKITANKALGYHEIFNENGAIVLKRN